MNVFWLEQTEPDLPAADDWLSVGELHVLRNMRFPKRRADWRLGRWTAKRAVAFCLGLPSGPEKLASLEIRAAASGEPEVIFCGRAAAVAISISHRSGVALCAVAPSGATLGCDLELIEPHSVAFTADYLAPEEQDLVLKSPSYDRALLVSLLWSAKESALKALHQGLRLDTRSVLVDFPLPSCDSAGWSPLRVRYGRDSIYQGCWSRSGNFLRTIVAATSLHLIPIELKSTKTRNGYADSSQVRESLHS